MDERKEAQSRTGANAGRNRCRLKPCQAHQEGRGIRHEPDSFIHWSDGRTRSKQKGECPEHHRGAIIQQENEL
jgi:hypothetical protein